MKRLVSSVSLGALALCAMGSLAAGQGTMAPMRPVEVPQTQQMPPAATAAPQQLGPQNHPCYPAQNSYPNSAQQLGAQYGPNQVYPGYQSGMGGMPGGSGIPGLGGTPGVGGGIPGMGGGMPGMGGMGGMGDMSGIVGMIAGQALNSHHNNAPPNGNGYYGGYGQQPPPNAQYNNGYYGGYGQQPPPNAQYGNGYYGGYGPQAGNPCPPR